MIIIPFGPYGRCSDTNRIELMGWVGGGQKSCRASSFLAGFAWLNEWESWRQLNVCLDSSSFELRHDVFVWPAVKPQICLFPTHCCVKK